MKTIQTALCLVLLGYFGIASSADVEAGKQKATGVCASCHGPLGISASDGFPNLAGQKAAYLQSALKSYQDGSRKAPIMNNMATNLTSQDIENLAAYFSGLKPAP